MAKLNISELIAELRKHDAAMTDWDWTIRQSSTELSYRVYADFSSVAWHVDKPDAEGIVWLRNNAGAIADELEKIREECLACVSDEFLEAPGNMKKICKIVGVVY